MKGKRYASALVFSFGRGLCFGNESPDRSHRLRSDLACEMSPIREAELLLDETKLEAAV